MTGKLSEHCDNNFISARDSGVFTLATETGSMHVSTERLSRFLRFLTVVHLWFQLNLYITPACRQPTSVGYPSYIVTLDIMYPDVHEWPHYCEDTLARLEAPVVQQWPQK